MYEYESATPGRDGKTTVIELLRPMAQADAPVEDPDGLGRSFKRVLSMVSVAGGSAKSSMSSGGGGGCCPCGKGAGACSRGN
jgi:hypothetical protein